MSDTGNNRVLSWNSEPITDQQAADFVLGQVNFTSGSAGTTSQAFSSPSGMATDGQKLILGDVYNSRVLIWNSTPATTQQAADIVLGQPDMTSGSYINGGISSQSMSYPRAVSYYQGKLFVSDYYNNRILIWNSIPTTSQQVADAQIGQADFSSSDDNAGGLGRDSLRRPGKLVVIDDYWLILDSGNLRLKILKTGEFTY